MRAEPVGGTCSASTPCRIRNSPGLLPAMNERFGDTYYMFGADYVWPQKMFETAASIVGGTGW